MYKLYLYVRNFIHEIELKMHVNVQKYLSIKVHF